MTCRGSGVLFDEPDSILSIGGGGRYSYLQSKYSLSASSGNNPENTLLNHFVRNADIFRLINSTGKLLHVSIGIADAGQYGDSGHTKFKMLADIAKNMKYPNNFSYEFFKGLHESNPLSEINKLETLNSKNKN